MAMKKFEMLNIICNNCNLTSKEKLVAHYFIYKSNKEGACYPAVNTIARHCGVSERTIQRATKKLQERGYLSISKRAINGRQTSNSYKLILDDNKKVNVSEAQIVTEASVIEVDRMNVVLLEDLLMRSSNMEEHYQSIDAPSKEINDNINASNINRLSAVCKIEELKSIIIYEDDTTQSATIVSENRAVAKLSKKVHKDIMIIITAVIWVNDRVHFIYKTIINGCLILIIDGELRLILYKYDIEHRRFFMPGLGVPP